jgi:hypothetical protein
MSDLWRILSSDDWFFHPGDRARVLYETEAGFPTGTYVTIKETPAPYGPSFVTADDGREAWFERTALVPDLDWDNVSDPHPIMPADQTEDRRPHAFFLTVFSRLKQVGVSRRTREPLLHRDSRVWGWFPTFAQAFRIVHENRTDIHECYYEYAMVELVPSGICAMPRKEWWWKWDIETERWLKAARPADFEHTIGLSIG